MTHWVVVSYSISTSNHNQRNLDYSGMPVVSYSISTSNHNIAVTYFPLCELYLIPFLHQTTTRLLEIRNPWWLYLIPFLHQTTTFSSSMVAISKLYLIPFLHQTTTMNAVSNTHLGLYLIPFLHQTTTKALNATREFGCILFHFYIKPQHWRKDMLQGIVVSYSISTSNHNVFLPNLSHGFVVSYSISTSNHNIWEQMFLRGAVVSYSISTSNHNIQALKLHRVQVVSYSISTSNHNCHTTNLFLFSLYLIPFLHQTTTAIRLICFYFRCILFHFYIKPQRQKRANRDWKVVSYSISTSNHNDSVSESISKVLYLIPFLHQTTTYSIRTSKSPSLYLIPFLHQTTTLCRHRPLRLCCILFHFYIKPQPMAHKTLFSSTLSPKSHSHFQRNAVV